MRPVFLSILALGVTLYSQAWAQNSLGIGAANSELLRLEADRLSRELSNNALSQGGSSDWKAEMEKMRQEHENSRTENSQSYQQLEKYPALKNMGSGK